MAEDDMTVDDYLQKGGVLSSPANVPPRYRAELLRLMASFVDSELAASAGFASVINTAPGIKQRINAARIVMEKAHHAEAVLALMSEFGADAERYASHHPWDERIKREEDIGTARINNHDMRLSVFYYPLEGWIDAVAMNALMGIASSIQLEELAKISYAPLAEIFRALIPQEDAHTKMGISELQHTVKNSDHKLSVAKSIAYWLPRVEATFGRMDSQRFERLKAFGLRHDSNQHMLDRFRKEVGGILHTYNLD
ncbi:Phenylacetic acid catabolic protein [Bartonella sp. LJL80]